MDHYELTFDPQPDKLNGISDEDRELYDTFEDEFDCLDQFCPWTPTGRFFFDQEYFVVLLQSYFRS